MSEAQINNQHIVVMAVFLAGGSDGYVDTEDVAVEASKLAPGRFSWRKYKDQINIDTVRKRLWDAAKNKDGPFLIGSEKNGWLLTESGLELCKIKAPLFKSQTVRKQRFSQKEQTWTTRERARILTEAAYQKWDAGDRSSITPVEAERLFRIDDYVIGKARTARLQRAIDAFTADPILGKALNDISQLVRER